MGWIFVCDNMVSVLCLDFFGCCCKNYLFGGMWDGFEDF